MSWRGPAARLPRVVPQVSLARYGNARHPARDPVMPDVSGNGSGSNTVAVMHNVSGPSAQSFALARTMALATNTMSPMVSGRFRAGCQGAGTGTGHRLEGRVDPRFVNGTHAIAGIGNVTGAIAPVVNGAGSPSVRQGMQSGSAYQPAYPSTGAAAGSPLAWMSLSQVAPRRMG